MQKNYPARLLQGIWLTLIFWSLGACGIKRDGPPKNSLHGHVHEFNVRESIIDPFLRSHNYFENPSDTYGNYTLNLGMEALITYSINTGDTSYLSYIHRFFRHRNYEFTQQIPHGGIPFSDPYFVYYTLMEDTAFHLPYLNQAKSMLVHAVHNELGAICHISRTDTALLIDYLQDVGTRLARAGSLSGDTSYYAACVQQFRIYHSLLRDPASGLYHQGMGWLPDKSAISPGCWSRGQAWLLRGMVNSLQYLPPNSSYFEELQGFTQELTEALIKKQDDSGMWHTLPCHPDSFSHKEVSGTAGILYYTQLAVSNGWIELPNWNKQFELGIAGLQTFVDKKGNISHISPGPGPLREHESYRLPGEQNNPHGFPFVLLAFSLCEQD